MIASIFSLSSKSEDLAVDLVFRTSKEYFGDMKQQLQPLASVDNFPAFRAEFARVFPSNMAPPKNSTAANGGTAVIDLTLDDEDQPPIQPVQPDLIDLTEDDSDELQPENQPLKAPSPPPHAERRFPGTAKQPPPIQPNASPARLTPVGTSPSQRAALENTLVLPMKDSPPPANRIGNGSSQDARPATRAFNPLPLNRSLADEEAGDNEEWSEADSPSRRPRGRPISPKSSTGTDSPLVTRFKHKMAQMKLVNEETRRDESPREVMARRSMSTEQHSQSQQPDIDALGNSLHIFQQRVLDDHAEATRWLLHDAKRLVEKRMPAFVDEVSPFASMQSIDIPNGQVFPEGATKVNVDTYVSTATLSHGLQELTMGRSTRRQK